MAWSLKGFIKAIEEVNLKAIEFHVCNGDFESWAKNSLKDQKLASKFKEIKDSEEKGEKLRKTIVNFAKNRYTVLNKQMQDATKLF
jgi:hypothetical protein